MSERHFFVQSGSSGSLLSTVHRLLDRNQAFLISGDITTTSFTFVVLVALGGLLGGLVTHVLIHQYLVPLGVMLGMFFPINIVRSRQLTKTSRFAEDFPVVLSAMASSLKVGFAPYQALERAVATLPDNSAVRISVTKLFQEIAVGIPRRVAISHFARDTALPDLQLFREALNTVMEHGGHFAPVLERLATVSRDRALMIHSARVTTALMRMTGNILALVAPVVMFIVSVRTEGYWLLLRTDPTASKMGAFGATMIVSGLIALREMGRFKP